MPRVFSFIPSSTSFNLSPSLVESDLTISQNAECTFSSICLSERKDFIPKSFHNAVSTKRNNYDFLSVRPETTGIASRAISEGKVDAIRVDSRSNPPIFKRRYFKRCEVEETLIELDISVLMTKSDAKELRRFYRSTQDIKHTNVMVFLVQFVSSALELRKYRDLQTIASLHGIPRTNTSFSPILKLLNHNRAKREGRILADGLEVLE